jgi:two-component system, chemotaxis family, protein-glutamate methylesterase/glutaminase
MSERVRVLVVDDSALMRKLIPAILARDPSIEVVGTAMDGAFALKKIEELRPDVVTLDLEMPRMDGMETLRLIMQRAPLPVILFSTHSKEVPTLLSKHSPLAPSTLWPSPKMPRQAISMSLPTN